jgi:hypothetical protein
VFLAGHTIIAGNGAQRRAVAVARLAGPRAAPSVSVSVALAAHACREGRYNLDPGIKFFATPPHHGSLAQVGGASSVLSWPRVVHWMMHGEKPSASSCVLGDETHSSA